MFCKIILVCAFIGMLGVLGGWLWDKSEGVLGWIFSLLVPGLFLAILLSGIMIVGEFMCICEDIYIFGFHPFWIGLCIGSGWYILTMLIDWIKSR